MRNFIVAFDIGMPHLSDSLRIGVRARDPQHAESEAIAAFNQCGRSVYHWFRCYVIMVDNFGRNPIRF